MTSQASVHIGIDGNEANVSNRVGSNIYAFELLHAIAKLNSNNRFTVYLKDQPLPDMPANSSRWQYRIITPKKFWTQIRLPLDLQMHRPRPDVFFSPGHYAPRTSPIPTTVTIMDLAFLHFPNLFDKYKRGTRQLTDWTDYSVRQASHIFAISKFTKEDIEKQYQYQSNQITVVYPGLNRHLFHPQSSEAQAAVRKRYHLALKFLLHVGTMQPRKNLIRLIEAFESLPPKYKTVQLVLIGQKGWLFDELEQKIQTSPKKLQIITPGFIDQADLPALMSAAKGLCMVGLFEGFGMPPAEALACGTLPIVANNTSLPEVVGKSGIMVDPYSVTSIRHGLKTALDLPQNKRMQAIRQGQKYLQRFDWQKSAKIVIDKLVELSKSNQN